MHGRIEENPPDRDYIHNNPPEKPPFYWPQLTKAEKEFVEAKIQNIQNSNINFDLDGRREIVISRYFPDKQDYYQVNVAGEYIKIVGIWQTMGGLLDLFPENRHEEILLSFL